MVFIGSKLFMRMSVVLIMNRGEVVAMIDWMRVRDDVLLSHSLGNLLKGGE